MELSEHQHPSDNGFWRFVEERYLIYQRRQDGDEFPWTNDPILQEFFFCNVKREWDAGTQWYLEHVAPKAKRIDDLIWRTTFYRMVNNSSWFAGIGGVFGFRSWRDNPRKWGKAIRVAPKPNSPAYRILARPDHYSRAQRLISSLSRNLQILPDVTAAICVERRHEWVWKYLQEFEGVGAFIANQITRDLYLSKGNRFPEDILFDENEFADIGPGCRPALKMLSGKESTADLRHYMHRLWQMQPGLDDGLEWLGLNDVQHCLCEYRKWLNLRDPSRISRKRVYNYANV